MLRKRVSEQGLGSDRWISCDPLDNEIIERLFKKDIREGEEKLMLAVLASAIQHFQKYVLSKDEKGKELFQEAEEWFLERDSDELFSFEYICETLQLDPDYIRKRLAVMERSKAQGALCSRTSCRSQDVSKNARRTHSVRLSKTA